MNSKSCRVCGSKLSGRSDKVFCDDHCRNSYHNIIDKETRLFVRSVNLKLRRNRSILKRLVLAGNSKISQNILEILGFDLKYFTNIDESKNGSTFYFVYEYGLTRIESDEFLIIKNGNHSIEI